MLKLLKLSFLPKSPDYGLLILRVALGFSMLLLHGRGKMLNFSGTAEKMAGLYGMPGNVNASLAIFAEVVCSTLLIAGLLIAGLLIAGLLIAGLFTRFAALILAITMGTAFFFVHKSSLIAGPGSGELAMVYLIAYITLLFTGAGKYSVDRN
jgi:putative oxidoreductase